MFMQECTSSIWVGLFYLRVSIFYLRLVFVAYGQLAWSFLLTVEIRFGLFLAYGENLVWSFLLTVPLVRKSGLVFFAYSSPPPEIGLGLVSGDRKWCRQTGSRQSTPLSTIRTRYGISVSTPKATRTGKTQQNSFQKRGRYGISVSTPHRRYGRRLRTPFLRTPFPRLLLFAYGSPPYVKKTNRK